MSANSIANNDARRRHCGHAPVSARGTARQCMEFELGRTARDIRCAKWRRDQHMPRRRQRGGGGVAISADGTRVAIMNNGSSPRHLGDAPAGRRQLGRQLEQGLCARVRRV